MSEVTASSGRAGRGRLGWCTGRREAAVPFRVGREGRRPHRCGRCSRNGVSWSRTGWPVPHGNTPESGRRRVTVADAMARRTSRGAPAGARMQDREDRCADRGLLTQTPTTRPNTRGVVGAAAARVGGADVRRMSLEGLQSGCLAGIRRKRGRYGGAFAGFEPERVAAFDRAGPGRLRPDDRPSCSQDSDRGDPARNAREVLLALDVKIGRDACGRSQPVPTRPRHRAPRTTYRDVNHGVYQGHGQGVKRPRLGFRDRPPIRIDAGRRTCE